MARTLTIGDSHCPFMHRHYLDFLERIRDQYKCDTTVHIGDLVDHHAASFHTSEQDSEGLHREALDAMIQVSEIARRFPTVKLCFGNHDRIPERKAKESAIPQIWMKDIREAYGLPSGWKAADRWVIDGVMYLHGTRTGKTAHILTAEAERRSIVMGHTHSFGGVGYLASSHDMIFGMNAGCGIDPEAYAFRYGKDFAHRPTLGCGVVIDGAEAFFHRMLFPDKPVRKPMVVIPGKKKARRR